MQLLPNDVLTIIGSHIPDLLTWKSLKSCSRSLTKRLTCPPPPPDRFNKYETPMVSCYYCLRRFSLMNKNACKVNVYDNEDNPINSRVHYDIDENGIVASYLYPLSSKFHEAYLCFGTNGCYNNMPYDHRYNINRKSWLSQCILAKRKWHQDPHRKPRVRVDKWLQYLEHSNVEAIRRDDVNLAYPDSPLKGDPFIPHLWDPPGLINFLIKSNTRNNSVIDISDFKEFPDE